MLDREEYIEQAYFFRALSERMQQNVATQDLIASVRDEVLSTSRLPMALDFLASELKLKGVFATAMARLPHYFTTFQTFIVSQAEQDKGRFDFTVAVEILHREADYRAKQPSQQGMFLYQFETLCRNRLPYDHGLNAMASDPMYDEPWRLWLQTVRRQIGMVDIADLIYVRSQYYAVLQQREGKPLDPAYPPLFGEKEGKIALANRRKDPLWLFAALQRHLGYPAVARTKPIQDDRQTIPLLLRRVERMEMRLKLLEEEQKGGIDLSKFFKHGNLPTDNLPTDGVQ
jgi:hypothetical protein